MFDPIVAPENCACPPRISANPFLSPRVDPRLRHPVAGWIWGLKSARSWVASVRRKTGDKLVEFRFGRGIDRGPCNEYKVVNTTVLLEYVDDELPGNAIEFGGKFRPQSLAPVEGNLALRHDLAVSEVHEQMLRQCFEGNIVAILAASTIDRDHEVPRRVAKREQCVVRIEPSPRRWDSPCPKVYGFAPVHVTVPRRARTSDKREEHAELNQTPAVAEHTLVHRSGAHHTIWAADGQTEPSNPLPPGRNPHNIRLTPVIHHPAAERGGWGSAILIAC